MKLTACLVLPVVVFSLVACSSAEQSSPDESTSSELQGGTKDTGDPAVGMIWYEGGGFCTGTLIAPTVVLTAGHCVQDPIVGFYTGTGTATKNMAENPARGFTKHAVIGSMAHPT